MDPAIAPLLVAAFVKVAETLAEKLLTDSALAPAQERLKKWLHSGYDRKKAEEELRQANQSALDDIRARITDPVLRLGLPLLTPENNRLFALCALEMVEADPEKIPDALLKDLNFSADKRPLLAEYLAALHRRLGEWDTFKPLLDFARQKKVLEYLRGLTLGMSNLSRDTNSLAAGLEMILQERLLSRDDGTALQKYLEEKSGEWSLLKIPYLRQQSSSTPGYVTLKDVFVPLSVYQDTGAKRDDDVDDFISQLRGEKREKNSSFFDFAARNTRFILLGLPGYGKSTSFSRLALALAEGRAQADLGWEDAPPLLPILVSLRSFGVYLASDQNRSKFPARFRKAKKVVTAALQIMQWTVVGHKRSRPDRAGRAVFR